MASKSVAGVPAVQGPKTSGQPAAMPDSVFAIAKMTSFVASSQSGAVAPDSGPSAHEAVCMLLGEDQNSVSARPASPAGSLPGLRGVERGARRGCVHAQIEEA
jgi:hypothetical protein